MCATRYGGPPDSQRPTCCHTKPSQACQLWYKTGTPNPHYTKEGPALWRLPVGLQLEKNPRDKRGTHFPPPRETLFRNIPRRALRLITQFRGKH